MHRSTEEPLAPCGSASADDLVPNLLRRPPSLEANRQCRQGGVVAAATPAQRSAAPRLTAGAGLRAWRAQKPCISMMSTKLNRSGQLVLASFSAFVMPLK